MLSTKKTVAFLQEQLVQHQELLAQTRAALDRQKPTRIYLVGSHRCGKTTLARWISKTYNLPLLTEVARVVLAEMEVPLDQLRVDVDLVGKYQAEVFRRQIAEEKRHERFVSDRAFDNLAYAAEYTDVFAEIVTSDSTRTYFDDVCHRGTVFFVRPHPRLLKTDEVNKTVVWEEVVRIDSMIKLLLEQARIRYVPVADPDQQQRQRLVEAVLGKR